MRAWLKLEPGTDAMLDKFRSGLDTWSTAAVTAMEHTDATANLRGEAQIVRNDAAETLTRECDSLHAMLIERANERSLPRTWPATFFRVESSSDDDTESAPTPAPTPS